MMHRDSKQRDAAINPVFQRLIDDCLCGLNKSLRCDTGATHFAVWLLAGEAVDGENDFHGSLLYWPLALSFWRLPALT
jgi:hypothetical protein